MAANVVQQLISTLPEDQRAAAFAALNADFEARVAERLNQVRSQQAASSSVPAAVQPTAMFTAPPPRFIKPAEPENFNGTRSKVEQFIGQLRRFMDLSNLTDGSVPDARQVQYAAQYIVGEAMVWFDNQQTSATPIGTVAELEERLRAHFQPYGVEKVARSKLRTLTQSHSVSAYNTVFMQTVQHLPKMDVADQVHAYIMGLKSHISHEMLIKDPKTLQEAMDFAAFVEVRMQNHRGGGFRHTGFVGAPSYRASSSSTSSSATTSAPMELGNIDQDNIEDQEINAIAGPLKKLSNEERDRLRKEGRCFRCRQKGHMSATCSKAQQPKNESSQH
jgi:Ty3 transposon capsid-like protein